MSLIDDWCADLPSVQNTTAFDLPEQSTIYANDGTTVLAELYMEKREPVTIDQVSLCAQGNGRDGRRALLRSRRR